MGKPIFSSDLLKGQDPPYIGATPSDDRLYKGHERRKFALLTCLPLLSLTSSLALAPNRPAQSENHLRHPASWTELNSWAFVGRI